MLFVIVPPTFEVFCLIWPYIETIALFLIIVVFTDIDDAISSFEHSESMLNIVQPFAIIYFSICPFKTSASAHLVVVPISVVLRLICPYIFALSLFFRFVINSFKLGSVFPSFNARSMHLIILPFTNVICPFITQVLSLSLFLIVEPVPIVYAAIGILKLSFTIGVPMRPETRVNSSIFPSHCSMSFSKPTFHLALIHCSCLIRILHHLSLTVTSILLTFSDSFH